MTNNSISRQGNNKLLVIRSARKIKAFRKLFPDWDIIGCGYQLCGICYDIIVIVFEPQTSIEQQWIDECLKTRMRPGTHHNFEYASI